MKISSVLFGVLASLSAFSAAGAEPQLPNVYDVKITITEPSGGTREAHAVVLEGAKATLRTNEDVAPAGTLPLKISFSVVSNPTASAQAGKEAGNIQLTLSKAEGSEWQAIASPKVTAILGSSRPATVALDNSGYSVSILTARVDATPYRDRILKLSESPANCDSAKPGKSNKNAITLSKDASTPSAIVSPCCCQVTCPDGVTWTCCNVISCSCGSSTCSPRGGSNCY